MGFLPVPVERLATLEVLYDAYHRQALGLAYRMLSDVRDAEEVVQEALLAAWRAGHTYDTARGSTRTWFLSLVRYRSIDCLRARGRRPVTALDETFEQADASDLAGDAVTRVDGAAARRALASLPPDQQQAIELAYFGGLSHTEIATRMATPVGTVKGRIRLGLNHLRTLLTAPSASPSALHQSSSVDWLARVTPTPRKEALSNANYAD